MPVGRKPLEIDALVERLGGSPVAGERLRVLLANIAGRMTAREACAVLGIEESWFFELKQRSLKRWLDALEPERAGRPPAAPPSAERSRIAELEERVRQLELELAAARLREDLAQAGRSRTSGAAKKARR
jgi:hypothetical protein